MSKSLFVISEEHKMIMNQVEEADGELSSELEHALMINEEEIEQKCKTYHHVIANVYDVQIAAIDYTINTEIERLKELREYKVRGQDRLKKALLGAVLQFGAESKTGVRSLEFDTLKLSTRRSKGGVLIDDLEKIETKYCNFSFGAAKMTQEQQQELKCFLETKKEEEESKWLETTSKESVLPDKKILKEALQKVEKVNDALLLAAKTKWIDEGNDEINFYYEGEFKEVPGASLAEDNISLVIK